ncbi:hypothetical protein SAMN05216350_102379 [Polaromonas sp. YR568]|uniref:hypothetical protein n=1 Tax=Polaromonas sp. YR568 TaxID=1855301 RepID=UPI0008E3D530|nr:hypothetical protein [Polaromonas sp. YR568]SFU52717.1 hypothetical protein SAMN05216350_102379 [Polaromonas sp. YR568]
MLNTLLDNTATDLARHAYNAAFEELGLNWHWDAATYARLQATSQGTVRTYLETEQSHLLRAYEADFLVEAIEAAKARCHASMAANRATPAPYTVWSHQPLAPASRAPQNTPAPRFTPSALHT